MPLFRKKSSNALEPDEIIIDGRGTIRDPVSHVDPWRRFVSRAFDYALFCGALWAVGLSAELDTLIPYEYFVWIPIEAAFVFLFGATPGKWLLNTRLQQKGRRGKIPYPIALKRSFAVWMRGFGLGIPFINIFCMLNGYQTLAIRKITSWDAADHFEITHRAMARWRLWLVAALAAVGIGLYEKYGRHV